MIYEGSLIFNPILKTKEATTKIIKINYIFQDITLLKTQYLKDIKIYQLGF